MRHAGLAFLLSLVAVVTVTVAVAGDYRYTIQLSDPGTVIRTDRTSGVASSCRNSGQGVWCPPSAEECRAMLEMAEARQSALATPSQREVIDCLKSNRCDSNPASPAAAAAAAAGDYPGVDDRTVSYCLSH
ncbi:MAG: hypothetical protein WCK65_02080 [Rhodospirillaceae bacterium]